MKPSPQPGFMAAGRAIGRLAQASILTVAERWPRRCGQMTMAPIITSAAVHGAPSRQGPFTVTGRARRMRARPIARAVFQFQ